MSSLIVYGDNPKESDKTNQNVDFFFNLKQFSRSSKMALGI